MLQGFRKTKREKGIENVFEEIMAENFPNLKKKTNIQVQKSQRGPRDPQQDIS